MGRTMRGKLWSNVLIKVSYIDQIAVTDLQDVVQTHVGVFKRLSSLVRQTVGIAIST